MVYSNDFKIQERVHTGFDRSICCSDTGNTYACNDTGCCYISYDKTIGIIFTIYGTIRRKIKNIKFQDEMK